MLAKYTEVRYIWIEDGKGQPLGRSFRVKLWPTLVFLRGGQALRKFARPGLQEVEEGFMAIQDGSTS